jgi:ABC-2 type transport system permease protein
MYLRSSFSLSLPKAPELKKPKTLAKTVGIAVGIVAILADISFLFVIMNLQLYDGLASSGMEGLLLLNAAITASVLVFLLAFMMALSMFSTSDIESGFLVLPFLPQEMLAAKMSLVYVTEAAFGVFYLLIAMIVYGIKAGPPVIFYFNGLVTALALPLLPTALAYLLIIPLVRTAKFLRNRTVIIYIGGFMGLLAALGFNLYIQSAMLKMNDPEVLAKMLGPDSLISWLGRSWPPAWLAWRSLAGAGSIGGTLAAFANLGMGAGLAAFVAVGMGRSYVKSLQAFGEQSQMRKGNAAAARGSAPKPVLFALVVREIRLMNREPMYMLNGPFVVILMPVILGLALVVQKDTLMKELSALRPFLDSPIAYLVPAAFGAFLGSATSISATAVSRDAKTIPWMRSLPVQAPLWFYAKLIHAQLFSVFGAVIGCAAGIVIGVGGPDILVAFLLALVFTLAFNTSTLWLDTAFPRLSWDNPIAAMKQNPNAVIAILGAMGSIGGLGAASAFLKLPRYGHALLYGAVFAIPVVLWVLYFPRFAARRMAKMEG